MARPKILRPLGWITLAVVVACGAPSPTPESDVTDSAGRAVFAQAPVIIISVDTLRSDRLPAYGYTGVETPAFDTLAAGGIRFERAFANYPLTLPSHASLFTGLYPTEHGVRDNVGYRLPDTMPTLASHFASAGYQTGGAISAYILRRDTGIGAGFDWYEDALGLRPGVAMGESQRPGAETIRRASGWLRETVEREGPEAPFFLFVHLYDPHTPYAPPPPFDQVADPYDGEIAAADAAVGTLLDTLRTLGVYDRSIIVLLSDHGEGLGDHGEQEHGILLYREALQVPLIVKLPNDARAGTTVTAPAQLVDVAPTLTALTGLAPLASKIDGVSLMDLAAGTTEPRVLYAETYYPRIHLGWSELISVVAQDLHFIDGPDPELFDLANDPAQRSNLLTSRRRDYARLKDASADLRRELEPPSAVDPETAAQLAALGYLSGPSTGAEGPLPDPKSQLHVLDDLKLAFKHFTAEQWTEAVAAFQSVVASNPAMTDAWEHLGLSLQRLGRHADAVAALEKALELTGGADHVALGLAQLFLETGQLDNATSHAKLALGTNPGAAHSLLASIALEAENAEDAEHHASAALEARPGDVAANVLLAHAALLRDDLDAMVERVERAEAAQAQRFGEEPAPGLRFIAGELYARQGAANRAETAFLDEIRLYPTNVAAYTRLAFLYAFAERSSDATAVLRQLVQTNDHANAYVAAVESLRALGDTQQAGRLLQFARQRFPDSGILAALD